MARIFDFILGQIDGELCMRRMESLRENYPKENFYAMMNLLGSHDVERVTTLLGEAPEPGESEAERAGLKSVIVGKAIYEGRISMERLSELCSRKEEKED